jgi:hypothetical protein
VWGGWLSKKPFQKELAMHRLTFDPGQRRVLLLVDYNFDHQLFPSKRKCWNSNNC